MIHWEEGEPLTFFCSFPLTEVVLGHNSVCNLRGASAASFQTSKEQIFKDMGKSLFVSHSERDRMD